MPPRRDVPGPRPVVDKQRAAGIMLTGTGCLGLSLRATTISAGIITLVESVLWAALSIASYAAYSCTYEVPKDLNINLRLAYILYYLDPGCQLLSDLTPADSQESLQVLYSGVLTAERTKAFSVAYICISFVWLGTSALLLATLVGRIPGRAGARLCIPWIILTAGTMLLDLIAMGFYSSDIAAFKSIEDVAIWTNVQIPREWLKDADSSLKIPPLILLLISLRGVVLWLLNGVLLVHVGRAVRMMMADERDHSPEVEITKRLPNPSDERQAKFAGAGHSSDPLQPLELLDKPLALQDLRLQRGVLEHQEAVGAIRLPEPLEAPEDLLETRLRPAVLEPSEPLEPLGSLEPEEQWPWNGVPEPLEPLEPRSHPGPLERLDSPEPSEPTEQQEPFGPRPGVLGPSAVAVLPALPLDAPRPGVALPLDAPRPGLVRAASAASDLARPSRGRLQSPQLSSPRLTAAKILDRLSSQRMSDREIRGRSESPRHRFERLSHLRTSGREGAVSPAIEAKINKIMRSSTSVTPPGSPSDRYSERTAWEYHDHEEFHEHDVFDSRDEFREPRHHHGPDYSRRVLEFEDVPQASSHRRHLPRLDRTQSDRPFGEWKMGQRPPGNLHSLHSLSPLHGARHARHAEPSYNPGQEATKELKKELPWSYLHNTSDQDPAFLDRDLRGPHGSPSKAVHNVYLPSEREDERSSRSPSSRAKPNEKLSSDVLMY